MSQDVFQTINPATTSGTQLAALLVSFKDALMSGMSGATRSPRTLAGGGWIDTSLGTSDNIWTYNIFDGTNDIPVFKINLATGKAFLGGSDSNFEITRISADTAGPLLKLIKNRIANSGQVMSGDTVGEIQFIGKTNAGANPLVGRMYVAATDNYTNIAQGAAIVFEGTATGQSAAAEIMRLVNGRLAVGLVSPDERIHALGNIKAENALDSTEPARLKLRKRRTTGNQVKNLDGVGALDFNTTDVANAEVLAAQVIALATQDHTGTARGTKLDLKVVKTGEAAPTTQVTIGDKVTVTPQLEINSQKLVSQNVASTASIPQLSADKAIAIITGSTATQIHGIDSTSGKSKVIVVHNTSTAVCTLMHMSATASVGADRMELPNGDNIEILADSSAELFYSETDGYWKVKSGSGTGGGGKTFALQTIAAGGTINSTVNDAKQLRPITGAAGGVTTLSTPFGVAGDWKDGTEIMLLGNSDANSVVIPFNDAANGCVGDFTELEITRYKMITFVWSTTYSRWILKARG